MLLPAAAVANSLNQLPIIGQQRDAHFNPAGTLAAAAGHGADAYDPLVCILSVRSAGLGPVARSGGTGTDQYIGVVGRNDVNPRNRDLHAWSPQRRCPGRP